MLLSSKEVTLLYKLVKEGNTIRAISKRLNTSRSTASKLIKSLNLKTKCSKDKVKYLDTHECPCCKKIISKYKFCSKTCESKHYNSLPHVKSIKKKYELKNTHESRKLRIKIINLAGGKCSICGYNKNYAALEFHHKEHSTKLFELSGNKIYRKTEEQILQEVNKCYLVCSNCHTEIHNPDKMI